MATSWSDAPSGSSKGEMSGPRPNRGSIFAALRRSREQRAPVAQALAGRGPGPGREKALGRGVRLGRAAELAERRDTRELSLFGEGAGIERGAGTVEERQ